jgi:hypothetical protein
MTFMVGCVNRIFSISKVKCGGIIYFTLKIFVPAHSEYIFTMCRDRT